MESSHQQVLKFNKKFHDFRVLQFLTWSVVGTFGPFIVLMLLYRNVSTVMIGTILMMNSGFSLLSQPLLGALSDKFRSVRKVYLLCLAMSIILMAFIPFVNNVNWFYILVPGFSFFFGSFGALLDSWTIQGVKGKKGKSFGYYRLWGSLGFSVMAVVVGKIIGITSIGVIYPIYISLAILDFFFILNFSEGSVADEVSNEEMDHEKSRGNNIDKSGDLSKDMSEGKAPLSFRDMDIGRLFKNYDYVTFLVFVGVLFMSLTSIWSFLPMLMKEVGATDAQVGLAQSIGAATEVPVLYFSGYLVRRFKPIAILLTSTIVFILRLFLLSFAGSATVILLTQTMHGFSYGLFLTGFVYYVDAMSPPELKATAQTIATAIFTGFGGMIGNLLGGNIIKIYSINHLYSISGFAALGIMTAFIISLIIGRMLKKKTAAAIQM